MDEHSPTIVATCEAAASYLGVYGLARGSFLTRDKKACLGGALLLAHGGPQTMSCGPLLDRSLRTCPAIPAVALAILDRYPQRVPGDPAVLATPASIVFMFNDHGDTTQEDVIDVLLATIKRQTPDEYRSAGA